MIIAEVDPTATIIGIIMAITALLGAYAAVIAKRTEGLSVGREEIQQAFDIQTALINTLKAAHSNCEERLARLEAANGIS